MAHRILGWLALLSCYGYVTAAEWGKKNVRDEIGEGVLCVVVSVVIEERSAHVLPRAASLPFY
ncbi:hypothetical protein ZHAS_00015044 [Anopheles sinensis]|uniref:Secreted protein n=1 Tax=Anopheles sinensis TaxID=74873 RepID=A0A084W9Y4_ANOSI|nr:hypothetical protein ZHAS_00015044 [Anopheles sinensis]